VVGVGGTLPLSPTKSRSYSYYFSNYAL